MNIFIDTNIFVSFYDTRKESLEELAKLQTVLTGEDGKLWITDQVIREFWKNRTSRLKEPLDNFGKNTVMKDLPLLIREDSRFSELKDLAGDFQRKRDEIVEEIRLALEKEETKADKVIRSLFDLAEEINTSGEIFTKAHERALRHCPPGKNDHIGDRLNWEGLLASVPKDTDLHIISEDSDFEENEAIIPYLRFEWGKKNGGKARLWKRLSLFMAENFPEAKNAILFELELSVKRLEECGSFHATHEAIEKFKHPEDLTSELATRVKYAILDNNQVRWITDDDDVKEFIQMLTKKAAVAFGKEGVEELNALLEE